MTGPRVNGETIRDFLFWIHSDDPNAESSETELSPGHHLMEVSDGDLIHRDLYHQSLDGRTYAGKEFIVAGDWIVWESVYGSEYRGTQDPNSFYGWYFLDVLSQRPQEFPVRGPRSLDIDGRHYTIESIDGRPLSVAKFSVRELVTVDGEIELSSVLTGSLARGVPTDVLET